MKIRYQLFLSFLVIVSIFLLAGFFNNQIISNIAHANEDIMNAQKIEEASKDYESGAKGLQAGVYLYVYGNRELGRQFMNEGTKKMTESRRNLKGMLANSDTFADIEEIERSEQKVIEASNDIISAADTSSEPSASIAHMKVFEGRFVSFDLKLSALIEKSRQQIKNAGQETRMQSENTLKIMFVGLFGSMLQSLIIACIVAERLTRPLKSMAEVMNKVSRGDINQKIEVSAKDEIGELAESIKRMVNAYKIVDVLDREK